ncbi:MAG: NnrS family protein, partial [Halioglobus sp.]|nr:NnrS family protein [Halioglobus sp.]
MQINEPAAVAPIQPLWRLGFRAGFLCAGLFAVVSMGRWLLWLYRPESWHFTAGVTPSPYWWHAHEMIFGFAMPVVAGFLLTAVANWTGIAGTRGRPLMVLFGLWLVARLSLWLLPGLPLLALAAELGFLALLGVELTRRVWAVRQWRNMLFTPVLLVLALLCCASYLFAADAQLSLRLHYGCVWLVILLVTIIGGRVTPLFTGNRLGLQIPALPGWFEYLCIGIVALIALWSPLPGGGNGTAVPAALYLLAGALHLGRLAHWRGWKTLRVPLLWSMHASYLCIPLALLGLGLVAGDAQAQKNMLHLAAVGSIGGMILAMMSRVAL